MSSTLMYTGVTPNYVRQVSNMDYARLMSYMPKWSAANFVETSNFSKVFSPIGRLLTGAYFNIETCIANNVVNYMPTEIATKVYSAVNIGYTSPYTTIAHGDIYGIGEAITTELADAPISGLIFDDGFFFEDKYSQAFAATEDVAKVFINSNILYITISDAYDTIEYPAKIIISGITEFGTYIDELIYVSGPYTYATKASFKMLSRIESDYNVVVANFIDLSSTHAYTISGVNKKIFTNTGEIFEPIIDYDNNKLFINVFDGNSIVDEYVFNTMQMDYLFVSGSQDVIGYKESKLYCGKLHIPIEEQLNVNSSYNNNDFVYSNKQSSYIGDEVKFTIHLENIREVFQDAYIQVIIENDGNKTFLNQAISGTLNDNTWVNQVALGDSIVFSIPISNNSPITVKLYINGFDQYLAAGCIVNQIHYREFATPGIFEGINQLVIRNNKLCIMMSQNTDTCSAFNGIPVYHEVDIIRDGYTLDANNIYTQFDFGLV